VLCFGVDCCALISWGGFPAVLRLMIGRSLSVSGNNFLGFVADRDRKGGSEMPVGACVAWVPFAWLEFRFLSVSEKTCRCTSHRMWRLPSILAAHPVKEQLMILGPDESSSDL
jgi:hypothetical protein